MNNPGRRQLEGVGEAHLSPGGTNRLHLLLLGHQTEHKHGRDSVQRQWTNMQTWEWQFGLRTAIKRPGVDYNVSREEKSVSPSKQQRPLYPPRFLHPVRRRSTPTRRPLFYAADHWTLVLDAPEDKQIDQSARPESQKWIPIPVALPSLTSPLLWVLSEATSQVNTHGSATEEKKKWSSALQTFADAAPWCSKGGLQPPVSVGGHVQVGFGHRVLLNQHFVVPVVRAWIRTLSLPLSGAAPLRQRPTERYNSLDRSFIGLFLKFDQPEFGFFTIIIISKCH